MDKAPSIGAIVAAWLDTHDEYDGLAGDECGCGLDDLMPCDVSDITFCVAGHRCGDKWVPGPKEVDDGC